MPAGQAVGLRADIEKLVQVTSNDIRNAFESEEYAADREQTVKTFQQQKTEVLERLNQEAQGEGFVLKPTPMGLISVPLRQGKPMTEEEFLALGQDKRDEIAQRQQKVNELMETSVRQARGLDRSAQEALQKLDQEVALYAIRHQMEHLKPKYQEMPEVLTYLEQVQQDMLAHISDFKAEPEEAEAQVPFAVPAAKKEPGKFIVSVVVVNLTVERRVFPPSTLGKLSTFSQIVTAWVVLLLNWLAMTTAVVVCGAVVIAGPPPRPGVRPNSTTA